MKVQKQIFSSSVITIAFVLILFESNYYWHNIIPFIREIVPDGTTSRLMSTVPFPTWIILNFAESELLPQLVISASAYLIIRFRSRISEFTKFLMASIFAIAFGLSWVVGWPNYFNSGYMAYTVTSIIIVLLAITVVVVIDLVLFWFIDVIFKNN